MLFIYIIYINHLFTNTSISTYIFLVVVMERIKFIPMEYEWLQVIVDLPMRKLCCLSTRIWLIEERIALRTSVSNNLDKWGGIVVI